MADNSTYKYVSYDNLNHFSVVYYQAILAKIPTKMSQLSNDGSFVTDASYVHTDNNYTLSEKEKLAGVEAGANKTTVTTTISSTDGNAVASSAVALALEGKVDKADGKTLTSNDLTNDLKKTYDDTVAKVAALTASGGEPNKIDTVKVNGTALVPDSEKAVNVTVPTDNASLANGAGYQTAANVKTAVEAYGYQTAANVKTTVEGYGYQTATQVDTAITAKGYQTAAQVDTAITGKGYQTKSQVDAEIASKLKDVTGISFEIVTSLPTTGTAGTIYLIAHSHGDKDAYDEYVYIESTNKFEKLGSTDVDLSGYVKITDLIPISNSEIDTMVSGATS